MLLIIFHIFTQMSTCVNGFATQLVCAMDIYKEITRPMEGYTIPRQQIHSVGTLDIIMLLPPEWHYAACCQRLQLSLSADDLYSSTSINVVHTLWTLCTPEVKHLFCCLGPLHSEEMHDVYTDVEQLLDQPALQSLMVTLQQCLMPEVTEVKYELSMFINATDVHTTPAPISGIAAVNTRSESIWIEATSPHLSSFEPCILTGGLSSNHQKFPLQLGRVYIPHLGTISYHFSYILAEPSNEVIFEIDFLREPVKKRNLQRKTCVKRNEGFPSYKQLSSKSLSLSIGNVWSGCHIDVVEGEPWYFCEGGRSFSESGWVIFSLKNCAPLMDTYLNYSIEILGPKENCTIHSGVQLNNADFTVIVTVLLAISIH